MPVIYCKSDQQHYNIVNQVSQDNKSTPKIYGS